MERLHLVLLLALASAAIVHGCATQADCSNKGQCRSGSCVCHDGWGGADCTLSTTDCPSFCFGHGDCLGGKCSCDLGYTGELCNEVAQACPQNCSGHGTCQGGHCYCKGLWRGDACDEEVFHCPASLNNCTGHGVCQPSLENPSAPWTCACKEGFCGPACNQACPKCQNNCTGHGVCDGTRCTCDFGFTGDDCSAVLGVCPKNCSGKGRCVFPTPPPAGLSFNASRMVPYCQCIEGFYGDSCNSLASDAASRCPRNCSGKGYCLTSGCQCLAGFSGRSCEIAYGNCEVMNKCSGNGKCVNGTCVCYPGYSGFDCTITCRAGWTGDVGCNSELHRGLCVNGTCICKPEWTGMWCDQDTTEGFLKTYRSGWNPLGAALISVVGAGLIAMAIFMIYNKFVLNKKGLNSVPGVSDLRSRVKGEEYDGEVTVNTGHP